MKNEAFDKMLSEIRNEKVDDQIVAQAGDRAWKSIAGAAPAIELSTRTLRSCEDFQALIPGYLAKQLAPARAMLFADHLHACVACRHAVEQARAGERQKVMRFDTKRSGARASSSTAWRWAMSAAAVAAVAVATLAFNNGMLPGQHMVRASVETVDGALYTGSGAEMKLIPAGYEIRNGDEVRTAKGSRAVVRLLDGSRVEMSERSDLSVSRAWRGITIQLDGGRVIVQAAKQRTGRLYVATDDGLISVKGTIFSVNHGTKGSRVAVIEGVVRVDYGENSTDLHAGDEATSSPSVAKVPIPNEIAWSKDSAKYLALLGDFAVLQKQFAAIPGPGLRYSSELLAYVPEHTVVYAAIPNLSNTLEEATRLFEDRLQQSPNLRAWWKQQQKGSGPKVEDVLAGVKTFSGYLGDEIVLAVSKNGSEYASPVVLAKVKESGLEDFVKQANRKLNSNSGGVALQTIRDPWKATPIAGRPLLVYVSDDVMIASPDLGELQRAAARAQQHSSSEFSGTPFYQQIARSYEQGAEWLFCADMEQIIAENVQANSGKRNLPTGIEDVRYLTMEHRELAGKTETRADLTFAKERQGVASWLGAPAPMGSLEFVSPDASMVTSAVIKNPKTIMEEMLKMISAGDANATQHMAEFEAKTGVNVMNDLAATLGGEFTMAFDGPMVPTPRWKLIFEVYDPATLQSTIAKLVAGFNNDSFNREKKSATSAVTLTEHQVGSRTYYTITTPNKLNAEIDYTFVDNYMVAAPDLGTISQAIQTRASGYTLTKSSGFQALVPNDGYTNFSAIFYHNLGPVVGPLARQLKSSGALNARQQQSADALITNTAPGLIYVYGESNRITVASNSGFMGFDLGTLLTIGNHGSGDHSPSNGLFSPQMLLGGMQPAASQN